MAGPDSTLTAPFETPRYYHFLTPDRIQLALDALADGWTLSGAARIAGVHRDTIYRHMESLPHLQEAVHAMREQGIDLVEDKVRQKVDLPGMPGVVAAFGYLKAHRREKWGDKLETTTKVSIQIILAPTPSPEELQAADDRMIAPTYNVLPGPGEAGHDAHST